MIPSVAAAPHGRSAPLRRLFEAGAALVGLGAGVLFAEPLLAAAAAAWRGFILPAYAALIEGGLLAWCL